MDKTLLNQTWPFESNTTIQHMNNTLDVVLPTKDHQKPTLDWITEKNAIKLIELILHCMFLVVGLFGNILTLVVIVSKKWTNITSRHILIALAVSDTIMLFSHTFNQDFFVDFFSIDPRALSSVGCKAFFAFYRTSKFTSSWFVAFICFERFVAVMFPLKVKTIITNMRTKLYILVTYLTMGSFALVISFSSATASKTCKKDRVAPNLIPLFKGVVLTDVFIYSVLPIILMSVLTPIIIRNLFKRYQTRKKLTGTTGEEREKKQLKETVRTTTILISVVVAFIICVTPVTVFYQVKFWLHISKKDIETSVTLFVSREISQRLEQVKYSINFFLYIFTSSTFRKTVLELLHIKQNRESNQSDSSNEMTKTKQCKAIQAELRSTSEQTYDNEVTDMDSVCH